MRKKELAKKISKAMEELGVKPSDVYSVGEMEKIAERAGCEMLCVMSYLRFGRVI